MGDLLRCIISKQLEIDFHSVNIFFFFQTMEFSGDQQLKANRTFKGPM